MDGNHLSKCDEQPDGFPCICDHLADEEYNKYLESEESRIYEFTK